MWRGATKCLGGDEMNDFTLSIRFPGGFEECLKLEEDGSITADQHGVAHFSQHPSRGNTRPPDIAA